MNILAWLHEMMCDEKLVKEKINDCSDYYQSPTTRKRGAHGMPDQHTNLKVIKTCVLNF